jgi:hypothetical protein
MRDLSDVLAGVSLSLPINGKTYSVKPLGWQDEMRIKLAGEAVKEGRLEEGLSDEDFMRTVLGDTLDEMRADNVPHMWIVRAAMTAQAFNTHGLTIAEHMWEMGPDPEALAASMRAAAEKLASSTTSPSTGAAGSSTKRRASTSSTSSRKAPQKRSPSRGRASSKSGN